jgi:hypothetical protein
MLTVHNTENTLSDPINAEYRIMSPLPLCPSKICTSSFVTSVGPVRLMSRLTQRKQMPPPSCAISYKGNRIVPYEFWH